MLIDNLILPSILFTVIIHIFISLNELLYLILEKTQNKNTSKIQYNLFLIFKNLMFLLIYDIFYTFIYNLDFDSSINKVIENILLRNILIYGLLKGFEEFFAPFFSNLIVGLYLESDFSLKTFLFQSIYNFLYYELGYLFFYDVIFSLIYYLNIFSVIIFLSLLFLCKYFYRKKQTTDKDSEIAMAEDSYYKDRYIMRNIDLISDYISIIVVPLTIWTDRSTTVYYNWYSYTFFYSNIFLLKTLVVNYVRRIDRFKADQYIKNRVGRDQLRNYLRERRNDEKQYYTLLYILTYLEGATVNCRIKRI